MPIRCKSWDCTPCAKRKAYQVAARIASGCPTKFITLTYKDSAPRTQPERFAFAKHAFANLVKHIRRTFGIFEYAAVWELTKAGNPHVHIAARSSYIPQSWLSHHWRLLSTAPIVDIRAVKRPHKVASYVTKYMLKSPTLTVTALGGGRLIQFSKRYLPDTEQGDSARAREAWTWRWLDRSFWEAAAELHKGFDLYDWSQDFTGTLHITSKAGSPLAPLLTDSHNDSWAFVQAYRIEEARLEREQVPNIDPQGTLFP